MPEDVRRRTPEVDRIARGLSLWSLDDPTEEPLVDSSSPDSIASPEAFQAFWRKSAFPGLPNQYRRIMHRD